MTQTEIKLWQDNLFNAIKDISDLEWQKLAWKGQLPNVVSSFSEVVCRLYDDFAFKDYISYLTNLLMYDDGLLLKLNEFDNMLSEYITIDMSDEKVLKDPNWHVITTKAEEVISIWN